MTYETAKQLKDAGFPQIAIGPVYYCSDLGEWTSSRNCEPYEKAKCGNHEIIVRPTLSELIEACGDRFSSLHYKPEVDTNSWWAYEPYKENGIACGEGSHPEEAVANLWLALNGKG